MDALLAGLRAVAESTRLRLLAILAGGELTVSEITRVMHQSQPRVSRHLKLLCDAGLLERSREGAWAFYRVARSSHGGGLAAALLELLPEDDAGLARDRERLALVRSERAERAAAYFRENAERWDSIRDLHVGETAVEQAMLEAAGAGELPVLGDLVDLGTGTGRVLELFSPRVGRGTGIDSSREMLNVARANLGARGIVNCQVRLGDLYDVPMESGCADVVTLHHVLHFLDDPAAAIREGARLLRPRGRLLVVDFAPHALDFLRTEHAHRRLGLADEEMESWCKSAGLATCEVRHLESTGANSHETLTVSLWTATR
ncbi:MAG: metalloregulator ArsR/SmtB family transcription factor [Deltaproteobacteria bacterium]|nr:metalloregulator ArsR/SmtB family transcription factor [Deltaproteobacteria bacterium]